MGMAVSRFWWPAGLCQELASRGFAVARYDQRDAGQSTRMADTGGSNPFVALARKRGAYTAEDMTDDAIAVLDALGWKQAHIFGASLGGIIAQRIALRHPDRVLSVTSMAGLPSDVSGLGGGRYVRFGLLAKLARAKVPEGREGDIQLSLMLARAVASPAYPFDERAAREWIEREADTGPRDTKAQSRQAGAAWHGPKLRELRKPVLVLHGDKDPLLRVSAARATARAIAGARLVILPGAGHDLPAPLWPAIADDVRQNADRAHAAEADSARPGQGRRGGVRSEKLVNLELRRIACGLLYPAASVRSPAALRMRPSTAAWNWRFQRRAASGRSIAAVTPANTSTLLTWVPPSGDGVKLHR
jgi:pimeloyl-ACP methyl ester carboxylesterase